MHPKRPPLPKPPPYGINSSSEPKPESDEINSPSHYTQGPIEVIEIIEGFENNLPNFGLPSHLANVIKYILRAGQKAESPALKDLLKAQYCLNRYIKLMQIAEESQKTMANSPLTCVGYVAKCMHVGKDGFLKEKEDV